MYNKDRSGNHSYAAAAAADDDDNDDGGDDYGVDCGGGDEGNGS